MRHFYGVQCLDQSVKSFVIFHQFFSQQRNDFYNYLMSWKKHFFLSPGHDRVVTIKSLNFSIAKVWCCFGFILIYCVHLEVKQAPTVQCTQSVSCWEGGGVKFCRSNHLSSMVAEETFS